MESVLHAIESVHLNLIVIASGYNPFLASPAITCTTALGSLTASTPRPLRGHLARASTVECNLRRRG